MRHAGAGAAEHALDAWTDPAPQGAAHSPDRACRSSPSSASMAMALPSAASVPARHSGVRQRRAPVRISPATPIQAPTPNAPKRPSCTGPATAPPPGSSRTAARITPAPIAPIPVSSRRRSRCSSGARDGAAARVRGRACRAPRRACACALAGMGRSEPFVNSMWNAWKTGYRGPWIGPDAISKSASTRCDGGFADRVGRPEGARRTSVPILHECVVAKTPVGGF